MADIKIDKIIRSRRRSVALIVMPDASLVIRAPYGVSADFIQGFVIKKSDWIEKKQKYVSEVLQKRQPRIFKDGEIFYLTGNRLTLMILSGKSPAVWRDGAILYMTEPCLTNAVKYLEAWYVSEAKDIIPARVKKRSNLHSLKFKSIRINNAKTRWGSCGFKNSLNFSWRLVMAPIEIIDYVIVHELIHTEIKNHSAKFHRMLEELMPDYKSREKWFKDNIYVSLL